MNPGRQTPAAPWALLPWALITAVLLAVLWMVVSWQRSQVVSGIDNAFAAALDDEAAGLAKIAAADPAAVAAWVKTAAPARQRLTLFAADGTVIADSAGDAASVASAERSPEVAQAKIAGHGSDRRSGDGDGAPVLYVAVLLADQRILRLAAPLALGRQDDLAGTFARQIATASVVLGLAAVAAFAARMVLDRWRFHELQDVSRAFARGEFARRANLTGTGASGQLGFELNRLGERLEQNVAEIATQRSLLDGALGVLDEGVACIDRLDRVVYANAAYRQLAAGGAEVDGQLFYEHVPAAALSSPLARARARADARRARGREGSAASAASGASGASGGDQRPIDAALDPLRADEVPVEAARFEHRRRLLRAVAVPAGPDIAVVVLHDLTAAHRLEQSRRDFMAAVSHEFKTPLTSLMGYTDTLLDGALEDPSVARTFVERIARHCERLSGLVTDVLTLSRLEQGAWEVRPEACRLDLLLPTVLDEYQAMAEARGITLSCTADPAAAAHTPDAVPAPDPLANGSGAAKHVTPARGSPTTGAASVDPGAPGDGVKPAGAPSAGDHSGAAPLPAVTITTDPELLRQLLGNLVSNAIRYNRQAGSVRLRLGLPDPDHVRIAVADTGIGIPVEHRERVYDRFYRVDAHRSRQTGGTGLGLAIVKQLLSILDGDIQLESGPDGSCFTITIPRSPASAPTRRAGEGSGAAVVVAPERANANPSLGA